LQAELRKEAEAQAHEEVEALKRDKEALKQRAAAKLTRAAELRDEAKDLESDALTNAELITTLETVRSEHQEKLTLAREDLAKLRGMLNDGKGDRESRAAVRAGTRVECERGLHGLPSC